MCESLLDQQLFMVRPSNRFPTSAKIHFPIAQYMLSYGIENRFSSSRSPRLITAFIVVDSVHQMCRERFPFSCKPEVRFKVTIHFGNC